MTLIFNFVSSTLPAMLVCHCKGLSEREIDRAICAGADSPGEVARRCGAGSVCGGCRPAIDELLEGRSARRAAGAFERAAAS
jgi:bacterioferritin-associated ferredoxin